MGVQPGSNPISDEARSVTIKSIYPKVWFAIASGLTTQTEVFESVMFTLNEVWLNELAGATGLEPVASCVTGRRSNQLNYAPAYYVVSFLLMT
jgi:hypothetical protein